jgi:hypothetical protein
VHDVASGAFYTLEVLLQSRGGHTTRFLGVDFPPALSGSTIGICRGRNKRRSGPGSLHRMTHHSGTRHPSETDSDDTLQGSVHKAFAALAPEKGADLERDLIGLIGSLNRAGPGFLVVPGKYLEALVARR